MTTGTAIAARRPVHAIGTDTTSAETATASAETTARGSARDRGSVRRATGTGQGQERIGTASEGESSFSLIPSGQDRVLNTCSFSTSRKKSEEDDYYRSKQSSSMASSSLAKRPKKSSRSDRDGSSERVVNESAKTSFDSAPSGLNEPSS